MLFIEHTDWWWWLNLLPLLYTVAPRTWIPGELVDAAMMDSLSNLFREIEQGTALMKRAFMDELDPSELSANLPLSGFTSVIHSGGKLQVSKQGAWQPVSTPTTVGYHEVFISASAMRTHPTWPAGPVQDVTLVAGRYTSAREFYGFQAAIWDMVLPYSANTAAGPWSFTPYWFNTAAGSGVVSWLCYFIGPYVHGNMLDSEPAAGVYSRSAAVGMKVLAIGPTTAGINAGAGRRVYVRFQILRHKGSAEDTYPNSAYLIGVRMNYYTDLEADGY